MPSENAYRPVVLTSPALRALAARAHAGEVTVWPPTDWASGDPFLRTVAGRAVLSVWTDPTRELLLDASATLLEQGESGVEWHDWCSPRGWSGVPPSLLVECECACDCSWAGRFDEGLLGADMMRCKPCSTAHPPRLRTFRRTTTQHP